MIKGITCNGQKQYCFYYSLSIQARICNVKSLSQIMYNHKHEKVKSGISLTQETTHMYFMDT